MFVDTFVQHVMKVLTGYLVKAMDKIILNLLYDIWSDQFEA